MEQEEPNRRQEIDQAEAIVTAYLRKNGGEEYVGLAHTIAQRLHADITNEEEQGPIDFFAWSSIDSALSEIPHCGIRCRLHLMSNGNESIQVLIADAPGTIEGSHSDLTSKIREQLLAMLVGAWTLIGVREGFVALDGPGTSRLYVKLTDLEND